MSEKQEQKKVVEYCKENNIFIYAIPAVVFSKRQGGFPIGYVKGLPDLCLPKYKLYIEMKDIKAKKQLKHEEIQSKVHEILSENGCNVYRCEGAEKAIKIISKYTLDN